MKFNKTFSKIIHNRFLLIIVFILSLITLLGNVIYGNIHAIFFFILLSLLTTFFSRNMTVVFLVPLLLVNLYTRYGKKPSIEGLENHSDSSNLKGKKNVANNKGNNQEDSGSSSLSQQEKINILKSKNSNSSSSQGLPIIPLHQEKGDSSSSSTNTEEETFQNNESKHSDLSKKKKYNIDYATTVEEAYDNLNKVIGGDGIKNLTDDTQRLMKQQLQLTEAMKNISPLVESMGPLLEKAGGLLNSMGGAENIGNLANLAKNFSAQ